MRDGVVSAMGEPQASKKLTINLSDVLSTVLFIPGVLLSEWALQRGWFIPLFCAVMGPLWAYRLVLPAKRLPLKSEVRILLSVVPSIFTVPMGQWITEHVGSTQFLFALIGLLLASILYILLPCPRLKPYRKTRNRPGPYRTLSYGVLLITGLLLGKWTQEHDGGLLFVYALMGLLVAYLLYVFSPWPRPRPYTIKQNRPVPE